MKEYTSPDGNVTVSTYSLVPSVLEVGTNLVCQAGNPRIQDSTLEDTWELKIHCEYSISQRYLKCKKVQFLEVTALFVPKDKFNFLKILLNRGASKGPALKKKFFKKC